MALTLIKKWSKLSAWKDPNTLNISFPINASIEYQHGIKIARENIKIFFCFLLPFFVSDKMK